MFDLRRIPIVRVLLPFAGGSLTGIVILHIYRIGEVLAALWLIWLLLAVVFWWKDRNPGSPEWVFSLVAFLIFFVTGVVTGTLTKPEDPGLPLEEKVMIRGEITEAPKLHGRNWSYGMNLKMACSKDSAYSVNTHVRVYPNVQENSVSEVPPGMPQVGETWQLYGQLVPIRNSRNPGSADYKSILNRKNCWYRFYVHEGVPERLIGRTPGMNASRIRSAVSRQWSGNDKEISLLKAVCLGDRRDLSEDLKLAYTSAGGIHLLAVSGLHMGLIWWVLNHLLGWMVRISGKEFPRSVTIIMLLWIYAFVTGFSSSVSRSATMFTLFTAGRLMEQPVHALNAILVSAFLLILIHPSTLLDVGFQLSYSAIIGIVTLYPELKSLIKVKNRFLRRVWEAAVVSIAAQAATAPLVIFYFHQFPVYALLTSLLTVPMLSVLIGVFVISLPFVFTGVLTTFFNFLLTRAAYLMNRSVEVISAMPGAIKGGLFLDLPTLFLWMAILLVVMIMLNHRSAFPRFILMALVSLTLMWTSWIKLRGLHSSELAINHFSDASMVSFREGEKIDHYCWYQDSTSLQNMKNYIEDSWSRRKFQNRLMDVRKQIPGQGAISVCQTVAPGLWVLGNNQVKGWFLSGREALGMKGTARLPSGFYYSGHMDFVVLSGNPSLRGIPEGLLTGNGTLILDGSNKGWYSVQFDLFKVGRPFLMTDYKTFEQGAYLKRW